MNKLFLFFLVASSYSCFGLIKKDLDGDKIKDIVYIDSISNKIVCRLSTKKFVSIYSKVVDMDSFNVGVRATKSGFEYYFSHMRAGYASQFRYDKTTKRIQLIGMSRYEFGPANNDGSGKSSVNLLTNDYVGEWNHFDLEKNKLIKMPVIKIKMNFKKQYLESYDGSYQAEYQDKCVALYYKYKEKM